MYYIKPAQGHLTSLFSNSRKNPVLGIVRPHQGIDIGNDSDNTIVAAANGKVRVADNTEKTGFGKYIVITHPNGQESLYAHLSSLTVGVGKTIAQGQKIGMKGTTGNSTGIHLHFEISKGQWTNDFSNKIDPLLLFIDPITKEIQEMLHKLGHKLTADGIYGDSTITAVSSYQKENKLITDGVCGRGTFTHIENTVKSKLVADATPSKPAPTPSAQPKPQPTQPQKETDIKMLTTTSGTLKKMYQDYLQDAIDKKYIDKKWLNDFNQDRLSLADAFLLDKAIDARKAGK